MDKGKGHGPDAIAADAVTYSELTAEAQRRELLERGMGRWGGEAKPPLPPGAVPLMVTGPWATADGLGIDEPVDVNGSDPSGTGRNRGII